MFGMSREGLGEHTHDELIHKPVEDYHLDPSKSGDPLEKMVEDMGIEGAFDELVSKLESNPTDAEAQRQANLLINRLEDFASQLRGKIQH